MPELPEVETIRRDLANNICGHTLDKLEFRKDSIIGTKPGSVSRDRFVGQELLEVKRHGKYLLFHFSNNLLMITHLRMTGRLLFMPLMTASEQEEFYHHKHTHVILSFDNGTLLYNDVRRFGKFYFLELTEDSKLLGILNSGPDALSADFTADYLFERVKAQRKRPIKSLLLDQKVVAGIGNIYADESLFWAQIKPNRPAKTLSKSECQALHAAIIKVLNKSIDEGGTTFSDYRTAGNTKGNFQNFLAVYGRRGLDCMRCGYSLTQEKISGRTSVYCDNCQF